MVRHFAALHQPGNLVVPIPPHRHRDMARRYNQSAELAHWLAPADEFAPAILLRQHNNKSQAELSRAQRQKNVAEAFTVAPKSRPTLSGRPVILIDDVMTTGATLTAATNCLLAAGSGPFYSKKRARVLYKDCQCFRTMFLGPYIGVIFYVLLNTAIQFDNNQINDLSLRKRANTRTSRPFMYEWYYGQS